MRDAALRSGRDGTGRSPARGGRRLAVPGGRVYKGANGGRARLEAPNCAPCRATASPSQWKEQE